MPSHRHTQEKTCSAAATSLTWRSKQPQDKRRERDDQAMTEEEQKAYAKYLVLDHARQVYSISASEMFDEYAYKTTGQWPDTDGDPISDDDLNAVMDLVNKAKVEVSW